MPGGNCVRVLLAWSLAIAVALVSVGCASAPPRCECDASALGGDPQVECGATECLGGVPYACTAGGLVHQPGTCGTPPGNPRPAGTPDVLFIAVSGHCFPGCDHNVEYLTADGTTMALAQAFAGHGLDVRSISTTDNFYDYPLGSSSPTDYGFLTLLASLEDVRDRLVADWDNPTRIIVVAHSHGTVWAHLALHVLEQRGAPLPVDVLIDIDGISISWETDTFTFFVGDGWSAVIDDYDATTGTTWPIPVDHPTDQFRIPGLSDLQDIEDIVPDSTLANLEIWSNDHLGVRDSQHNHRLDGSERDIAWFQSAVNHETSDNPDSDGVAWAVEELRVVYGL